MKTKDKYICYIEEPEEKIKKGQHEFDLCMNDKFFPIELDEYNYLGRGYTISLCGIKNIDKSEKHYFKLKPKSSW